MVEKFDNTENRKAQENLDTSDQRRPPVDHVVGEIAWVVAESLWTHQLRPKVAQLFSAIESRVAARRASQDTLSRLSAEDPETDQAYAHLV
ncbi:MAG TPA: hypothetical protein V6D08_03965 [Candidatus Obscuribacterales bacterium]